MKRFVSIICMIFISCISSFAQQDGTVTIKAGTNIRDYFPPLEKYLYPNFEKGKITLKDRRVNTSLFNYNLLSGEMEFIQGKDTLVIKVKDDLYSIVTAHNSFFYTDTYLRQIRDGKLKVFVNQQYCIVNLLKQGAMGTTNNSVAIDSYDYVIAKRISYNLKAEEDMVIQKVSKYFISTSDGEYFPFNKKNVLKLFSKKGDAIKGYIKSNTVDFNSKEDLLKLADFVSEL